MAPRKPRRSAQPNVKEGKAAKRARPARATAAKRGAKHAGAVRRAASKGTPKTGAPKKKTTKKSATARRRGKPAGTRRPPPAPGRSGAPGTGAEREATAKKKGDKLILSLYERGIKALYGKQYQQAMDIFVKLIDEHPDEIELADRARNFIKICQAQGATKKAQQPKNADEMFNLGVLEHNNRNFQKAIDYFQSAIALQPKTDYLYYALAASHGQAGDADLCIRALQKAIQLNSQSRFHARNDPDFEPMRNNKEFSAVLEPPGTE